MNATSLAALKTETNVTFDTNVLISASLSTKGSSYALIHLAAEGKITGNTSKTLIDEFKEILTRDHFFPLERVEHTANGLLLFLKLMNPQLSVYAIKTDEDDNRVLECAVAADAEYIASWDPPLTNLVEFEGIKILNPGKLLAELKEVHGIP